jgi:glycosyltransferase involved in cell wall biosynthesis
VNSVIFSVIVPTYNRLESLKRTIESLFSQQFPDFEIIVVNDGSSDGTHNYLTSLASQGKIKYHHHANSGLAATRKAGLKFATGEFIAFTDDDCRLPADWLSKYYDLFQNSNAGVIGGPTQTGDLKNPCADTNDFINNYFKKVLNGIRNTTPYLTGNNIAFRRSSLEKVGGPDPLFRMGAEDRDLLFRLHHAGEKILLDPENVIEHFNNATFKQFVKHQFVQGKGSYLYYTHTAKQAGKKPPNIPLTSYIGLLFAPFRSRTIGRAIIIFSLIIIAQVSVTIGLISSFLRGKSIK